MASEGRSDKLREECGVFGIMGDQPINAVGYTATALLGLQHRGQQSSGIASFYDDGRLVVKKDNGLATEIFDQDFLDSNAFSYMSVGHVRYSGGGKRATDAQPLTTTHSRASFALACNGSIVNAAALRRAVIEKGGIFYTNSDSEIISVLIIEQLIKDPDLEKAVFNVMDVIQGAFSFIVGTQDKLIAARDKNGFRPLCMGKLHGATVFSSESCALDGTGADFVRDIKPGELVSVDRNGKEIVMQKDLSGVKKGLCVFEFVYFARPDSFIDGMSVYEARVEMGRALARQQKTDADMVCGVPDSALPAAHGYAVESGIPYGSAFIKNRYIGRSFIIASQADREKAVSAKLNPLKASVNGKRIILVDDSIVRGTTIAGTIKALREAGAKEIHLRISSPPFKFPCHFGTDVKKGDYLIANHHTIDEICKKIGADSLVYLTEKNLMEITLGTRNQFCGGCFSGKYPIEVE